MKKYLIAATLLVGLLLLVVACQPAEAPAPETIEVTKEVIVTQEVEVPVTVEPPAPWEVAHENVPVSLHETTEGMRYFYSAENGGFETLTGVPYDDLHCKDCHVGQNEEGEVRCEACHITQVTDAPPQFKCIACHGRQNFEIMAKKPDGTPGMTDVHYAKGMQCINCHGVDDVHGDGESYNSLHEMDLVACSDCHGEVSMEVQAHSVHNENIDCAGCHVQNVINCVNCHFDTELEGGGKVAQTRYFNWKFLLKDAQTGKYTTGIIMSMVTGDQTFVAAAPFYGHTISKPDPATVCDDCHQSAAVAEYNETGKINIQTWNQDEGKFTFATGVIPFPADYQDAFVMDFVTRDGDTWNEGKTNWTFLKTGVDLWQMLYAEPLETMPPQMDLTP
ncbi:MAG: hypothetical protein Kow002_07070 [Anaerolineales bacterium]